MMLIMACELAGILLRIIVVISCYINSIYFPYLLPCLLKLLEFFPCNHSLCCFPSKILSCPCLFQCSQPFSIFLLFAMKSLPSFQFHNQPFPFPTFLSIFFLLLSTFLMCWILLFLTSPRRIILFSALSFPSLLLVLCPSCSGFQGGIPSFILLVQMMGRGGMTAAYHVIVNA